MLKQKKYNHIQHLYMTYAFLLPFLNDRKHSAKFFSSQENGLADIVGIFFIEFSNFLLCVLCVAWIRVRRNCHVPFCVGLTINVQLFCEEKYVIWKEIQWWCNRIYAQSMSKRFHQTIINMQYSPENWIKYRETIFVVVQLRLTKLLELKWGLRCSFCAYNFILIV